MEIKVPTDNKARIALANTTIKTTTNYRFARLRMGLALAIGDLFVIFVSCVLALFLWSFVRSDLYLPGYVQFIPLISVFVVVFFLAGLYSTVGVNPVEELRQQTITTVITFVGLGALSFWVRNADLSRASFIMATVLAVVLLPVVREVTRSVSVAHGWWGEPVAVIGYGDQGDEIYHYLLKNPKLGLNPVVLVNNFYPSSTGEAHHPAEGIPVIPAQKMMSDQFARLLKGISTAILVEPDIPEDYFQAVVQEYGFRFSNLIWITSSQRFGSLWVTPMDLGGVLGLRVRQNLLSTWQQTLKRAVDLVIITLLSPQILPLVLLIMLLIRLDTPGRIFYAHTRIGHNGKKIKVWKFRTMVHNADEVLETYLATNPDYRREWEASHKIKDDPRVTRVGRLLRKYSMDALPQFWNILKGDMSMVGPRPIIDEEMKHYGARFKVYTQVKPGLTGLWQVSGRNNVDYPTRVRLDEYYVRNWSFWFDIYILAHTPQAILSGKGAY